MEEQKKTVEQEIVDYVKMNGLKLNWVSKNIGISNSHFFMILKGEGFTKRELTQANLDKINELLKTDFKK